MGISATAYVAYGLDLGDELPDEDYEDGFTEWAEDKLLEAVGFTETDWQAEGYFDRRREAEAKIGVEVDTHCHYDYPMYVLIITESQHTAWQGDVTKLKIPEVGQDWDDRLRRAAEILSVSIEGDPSWLLYSMMG